jgi:hypothetical protein
MPLVRKVLITLGTSFVFTIAGRRIEKRINKILELRETKGIADDKDLKSPGTKDRSGGSRMDWISTSILKKHKSKIPLIALLAGVATGSSIAVFEKQIYQYLLLIALKTSDSNVVNDKSFGLIDSSKNILDLNKVKEFATIIETFSLSPKLNDNEKIIGYKVVIEEFLEFDSKIKFLSGTLAFASLLAYYFSSGNLFLFGQIITALISLIKEGRVSTAVARMVVNALKKKGIPIPDELNEIIK